MGARWHIASDALGCTGGPRQGTTNLEQALLGAHGSAGAASWGIYNCRKVGGSGSWSLHAEGRALDLAVGVNGQGLGDLVLMDLLANAWDLGLQRVIWWSKVYDHDSPTGRAYHGVSPHEDHLHIEQTRWHADNLSLDAARRPFQLLPIGDLGDEMVIVRRLENHEDSQRWLLSSGRRIVLNNWANVEELMIAGMPTISLTDAQLRAFPQVG